MILSLFLLGIGLAGLQAQQRIKVKNLPFDTFEESSDEEVDFEQPTGADFGTGRIGETTDNASEASGDDGQDKEGEKTTGEGKCTGEAKKVMCYLDADGDGFGKDDTGVLQCNCEDGYVERGGDCNDSDSKVQFLDQCDHCTLSLEEFISKAIPVAKSQINGRFAIYDECHECKKGTVVLYYDRDGDTYGKTPYKEHCLDTPIPDGFVTNNEDCNDTFHSLENECEGCEDGDESYEKAIKEGDIQFTKKYGWVDMKHAFTDTKRVDPYVGAKNLWRQLKAPPAESQVYMGYYSVNYKQDVVRLGLSIGIERQYLVKPDLSFEERKSVALAIFQNVSMAFELLQSVHPTSGSSFEPADLPSNMIGFYMNVQGVTEDEILDAIEPVGDEKSLEVFRLYPCTFTSPKYKSKTFDPVYFESPYTSKDFGIPDILNTIKPMEIKTVEDFGNADLIFFEQDIISK